MPFATFFIVTEKLPNQYDNTYLAELNDKYELLCNTNDRKIIFVGGSSLPFGLRSDLIEQELHGYKVVNFGLYATLGTKLMMDLSKANINQGDIVILSPELSVQTYSLYFNAEAVLQACDGFAFKYKYLSLDNNLSLFYNYYKFAYDKISYVVNQNQPDPIGIYRHDSFNEYGDIKVERANNIMNNGVDSTMQISTDDLLDEEFIDYVNDYISYVRSKKAKIYFNFSPCNELAITSSSSKRSEFQQSLTNSLECDLLSNLDDCIMDYRYFYDTNFHLNSSGAIYYSNLIINNIKLKLGMETQATDNSNGNDADSSDSNTPSIVVPTPPDISVDEVVEPDVSNSLTPFNEYNGEPNNDYLDYFNYRLVGSSYQIISIKDEYKDIEEVILPSTYNGKNVTALTEDALYGCVNLKRIYIGLTYKTLEGGAFNGCISLERIYLYELDGNTIQPDQTDLLKGAASSVAIYIPVGANYQSGYTWMNYSNYFVYFEVDE
jgi:hypothetical protein